LEQIEILESSSRLACPIIMHMEGLGHMVIGLRSIFEIWNGKRLYNNFVKERSLYNTFWGIITLKLIKNKKNKLFNEASVFSENNGFFWDFLIFWKKITFNQWYA
jgi:hypothetical protein